METLGIHDEIQTLVSDKLQVVSYKWLSRNFLVSSNAAKRLLQQFVQKHGNGLEVVYSLSGWLKNDSSSYHIRLVSAPKLEEAKQEFDGNCSVQVYSVQACVPKDPAMLWNAEFIQAEELFKQPFTVDNCLRDNRFCGILNSIVKRNVDGTSVGTADPQAKTMGLPVPSTSNSAQKSISVSPVQPTIAKQSSPQVHQQLPNVAKDVQINSTRADSHDQFVKPPTDTEKVPALPANRKIGQNDKSSSGNGGSLANLWGRASAKSKPTSPAEENNLTASTANAEGQIHAQEAIQDLSSDDEAQDFNFRRASNGEGSRKRRVVLDYSDDEGEEAVNLSSPDLPKGKLSETLISEKPSLKEQTVGKSKVKEEKPTNKSSDQHLSKDFSGASKGVDSKTSSVKIDSHHAQDAAKENIAANTAPASPKRRKVLKTRIDERGREVTEVVWEGDEVAEKKKVESNSTTKAENNATVANTANSRQPAVKKSPAIGNMASSNTGAKAGNKKGANKDPKQGNIMSFFKRV